jgi:SAM-dependent methyltransferase
MTFEEPHLKVYHPTYHQKKNIGSLRAARTILPILFDSFDVRSVVDFGCGAGTWLAAAKELGVADLTGIEGPWAEEWVDDSILARADFSLTLQSLEEPVRLNRRFDLAVSLETAEHLSARRARSFVEELCAASDRILFAAAIPGQGGNNHFNEQWPSYWASIFARSRYVPVDCIRSRVWNVADIPWWYRQNCILYVQENELARIESESKGSLPRSSGPLDVIHPDLFAGRSRAGSVKTLIKMARHPVTLVRALRADGMRALAS